MADMLREAKDDESEAAFAEASITFWSNLLTLTGTHMLEKGMPGRNG